MQVAKVCLATLVMLVLLIQAGHASPVQIDTGVSLWRNVHTERFYHDYLLGLSYQLPRVVDNLDLVTRADMRVSKDDVLGSAGLTIKYPLYQFGNHQLLLLGDLVIGAGLHADIYLTRSVSLGSEIVWSLGDYYLSNTFRMGVRDESVWHFGDFNQTIYQAGASVEAKDSGYFLGSQLELKKSAGQLEPKYSPRFDLRLGYQFRWN